VVDIDEDEFGTYLPLLHDGVKHLDVLIFKPFLCQNSLIILEL